MTDAFLCDAIRTPVGRYGGILAKVRADDLGAVPMKAQLARNPGLDPTAVDEVSDPLRHGPQFMRDRAIEMVMMHEVGQQFVRHPNKAPTPEGIDPDLPLSASRCGVGPGTGIDKRQPDHAFRCLTHDFQGDVAAHRQSDEGEGRR